MSDAHVQLPYFAEDEKDTYWRKFAKCKDMDTNKFFPQRGESVAPIKMICFGCQVRKRCAKFAIDNCIDHGVYGGLTDKERNDVRAGRLPLDISLLKVLRTAYHAINNHPPRANGRMWMTKDVIREASERTGIPIRVVRGNLDNAHDYYI